MTCPITVRLGVYALGAADAAERAYVESHLATCQACRAELDGLTPLAGLLARVPVSLVETDPRPARLDRRAPAARTIRLGFTPERNTRASAWRWRGVAGVAAAATLGVAGGIWLAQPGVSRPPAPAAAAAQSPGAHPPTAAVTLSGANPVTHVRVAVTLTRTSWGTSIRLRAWGLPLNQSCHLIVHSRGGGTEIAGAWDAWRAGPVSVPASAAWRPADISSLQVATASTSLVTVTAWRPGTHVPPTSLPSG